METIQMDPKNFKYNCNIYIQYMTYTFFFFPLKNKGIKSFVSSLLTDVCNKDQ